MLSDTEAIRAVMCGEKDRYAVLVERYQRMVYGIAWSRLGDADLCEEAAQETFIKAFRYLGALRHSEKFAAWLARIARNVSASLIRKHRRELDKRERWRLEPAEAGREAAPIEAETPSGETLRASLAALPERHRECLVLFYLEGKGIRECATVLGISQAATKTRLHRARTALRERLEERLAADLAGLGPREGFVPGLMPALPSAPLAAGGITGASALGKLTGLFSPGSLFFAGWFFVWNGAIAGALHGWLGRLEAANLKPGADRGLRAKMIRRNVLLLVVVTAMAGLFGMFMTMNFGSEVLFRLLIPFCAWGVYSESRKLRFNRSPFVMGLVGANLTFLLVAVLVGFFGAPFWTFFAALLPLNCLLYFTNASRPMRHDYSLFLRQVRGKLGDPGEAPAGEPADAIGVREDFARFLGERFLIAGYRLDAAGLTLTLPPVKPGMAAQLNLRAKASRLHQDPQGGWEAHLCAEDRAALEDLAGGAGTAAEDLEGKVAAVADHAFRLFARGEKDAAERLLQPESAQDIFWQTQAQTKEHRYRGRIAIIAAALMLVISVVAGRFGFTPDAWFNNRPDPPASEGDMRAAFEQWIDESEDGPGPDLDRLMERAEYPPLDLLSPAYQQRHKELMAGALSLWGNTTVVEPLPYYLQGHPRRLYHALDREWLSAAELAEIGFSAEAVRKHLSAPENAAMLTMAVATGDRLQRRIGPKVEFYSTDNIAEYAYRLACLEAFDCLDLVDADRAASRIAARQVGEGWETPAGYHPIDPKAAAGLFHFGLCNIKETWAALWALEMLKRLDAIDGNACREGILRFYEGRGRFHHGHTGTRITFCGNDDDCFYALESLRILGALGEISDLTRWRFSPRTQTVTRNGAKTRGVVTPDALATWALQRYLEDLRAGLDI